MLKFSVAQSQTYHVLLNVRCSAGVLSADPATSIVLLHARSSARAFFADPASY